MRNGIKLVIRNLIEKQLMVDSPMMLGYLKNNTTFFKGETGDFK